MARSAIVASCLFLGLAVGLSGCKKEKDTKATILVLNGVGAPVAGAYVKLYADPEIPQASDFSRLNKEGITDGGGRITFDYSEFYKQGQAGFAVLDILATFDTLTGEGIIRIEEEQMNEETVTVLPVE
ncbi:MAG TPA: hypothetical protein VGE21_02230 [Flavobacteriales bacterium]